MDHEKKVVDLIRNGELVTSHFGFWPSFHDAEVMRVELTRGEGDPALILDLYAFEMLPEVDERGVYKLAKRCVVTLACNGCRGLELDGFNEQNVLAQLTIEPEGELLRVVLHPCYGIWAEFTCERVEVLRVRPLE